MIETKRQQGQWAEEFDDIARAVSGAFLFGTPLLFTMEMWWLGTHTEMWRLLIFLGVAFAVNVVLAKMAGFTEESSWWSSVFEAVTAMAVGAIIAISMLLVLNQIAFGDPLETILGKVVLQTLPLSIGASVANALLGRSSGGSEGEGEGEGGNAGGGDSQKSTRKKANALQLTLRDLGATIGGGILIGFSVAPTEEIPMLATELQWGHKLALIALTLVVTYLIVFESGFSPQDGGNDEEGPFQHPLTETAFSYTVSLALAFVVLLLFKQIEWGEPIGDITSKVLVLGTPTAIGGAAGRALIGGSSGGG